jgi:hypothetical protein
MAKRTANPKNVKQRALAMLATCLDAAHIPYLPAMEAGRDLVVEVADGGSVDVTLVFGPPEIVVGTRSDMVVIDGRSVLVSREDRRISVPAQDVVSLDSAIATAAFHQVTAAAGRGTPSVIDRGHCPTRVTYAGAVTERLYREHDDLVVFRHRLFRRVPNPPPEIYARFDGVIRGTCRKFARSNERIMRYIGWDQDDLKSYAQVWTAIFWATARILDPARENENEALLYGYLRQRFVELHQQLEGRRLQNALPDRETAAIGTDVVVVRTYKSGTERIGAAEDREWTAIRENEPIDEESANAMRNYAATHAEIDVSTVKRRRESASLLLRRLLGEMPHDRMVEALRTTADSTAFCPDTRQEAVQQLRKHAASCPTCATGASPASDELATCGRKAPPGEVFRAGESQPVEELAGDQAA